MHRLSVIYDDDEFDYIGDGPFGECNEAASSGTADWISFCNSLIGKDDRRRCFEKSGTSEQEKRNWCYDEFGE